MLLSILATSKLTKNNYFWPDTIWRTMGGKGSQKDMFTFSLCSVVLMFSIIFTISAPSKNLLSQNQVGLVYGPIIFWNFHKMFLDFEGFVALMTSLRIFFAFCATSTVLCQDHLLKICKLIPRIFWLNSVLKIQDLQIFNNERFLLSEDISGFCILCILCIYVKNMNCIVINSVLTLIGYNLA